FGGLVPPSVSERLHRQARESFDRLIDLAIAERVAFVVLAGDIYDDADKEAASQARFHRGLEYLYEEKIPVFMVHGTHDPAVGSYAPLRPLPPNVTVFGPDEVQVREVAVPGVESGAVTVAGISHASSTDARNLVALFSRLAPLTRRPTVGVVHADVAGAGERADVVSCTESDVAAAKVHYLALGHRHRRAVNRTATGCWWAYPGNLQGRSLAPFEQGPKGALIVPLLDNGTGPVGEPRFVACDSVRFATLDVDVTHVRTVDSALSALLDRITYAVYESEGRPLVVRGRFVGMSHAHDQLWRQRHQLLAAARADLGAEEGAMGGLLGEGILVRVDVESTPVMSRERLAERGDLLAEVLGHVDDLRDGRGLEALLDLLARSSRPLGTQARHPTEIAAMLEVDETDADALRRSLIERVELLISNSLTTGEAGSL
ncbi:MAG: hypothetical protein RLY50_1219, partial [Actinomycetota bacterium]